MALDWLEFDFSEDEEGNGSFDAMAAAGPAQLPALQAEIAEVLQWAERAFGAAAPLEDGGGWDYELQGVREFATTLAVDYDAGQLRLREGATGAPRVTLSLTRSGTPAFCAALRQAFDL